MSCASCSVRSHAVNSTSLVFTTVHRHRDGTDIPVEILIQAIPGESETPTRYVKIARDVRERLEAEERLHRAEQHLRVVEDRERIARDLHDIVIQKLFAAGMTIQGVAARTADPEHGRRLAGVVDELDETIREIRSVIFSLQTDAHDTYGVRAEVLRIIDEEREALGCEPRIRFDGPVDAMDERVAAELLPTLREALSNVAKHSGASSVEVVVDSGEAVTLRVLDNGRGMPAAADRRTRSSQPQRAGGEAGRTLPGVVAPRRRHRSRVDGAQLLLVRSRARA